MQERALGAIESNFLLLHDHFGGSYTSAIAAKIRGPLDRNVARAALEALVARHPLLRARIARRDDDETPHFVVHDGAWNVVMGEWTAEHDDGLEEAVAPFVDRDAPLWRCLSSARETSTSSSSPRTTRRATRCRSPTS
jgi:hypothetical protein